MSSPVRDHLLALYRAALQAVNGQRCCGGFLRTHRPDGPLALVAIGKAAESMTQGVVDALGEQIVCGLVIGKDGERGGDWPDSLRYQQAGHPLPDARSVQAGRDLLTFIEVLPAQLPVLFLLSGGASALVEVLPAGVGLSELQRLNAWLLASGLDIAAMNALRASLSCIKGGRLAQRLMGRRILCLMISDVPGDDPAVIGSGLLVPVPILSAEEWADLRAQLPAWLLKGLPALQGCLPSLPLSDDACFATVDSHIVARLSDALAAACVTGEALGYSVHRHATPLSGDAAVAGRAVARQLCDGPKGLHLWGGETSVRLPEQPGQGGRNQHLALAAAEVLAAKCSGNSETEKPHCTLLCAGTDGSDGPGEYAGAMVDSGTLVRGEALGLSAEQALESADSGRFLQASEDQIATGNTGTNVTDIVFGINGLLDDPRNNMSHGTS